MPKPGTYARIYQNPLFRDGEQGWAILREKKNEDSLYEFWEVEFTDTGEKGVRRLLKYDYYF